MLIANPAPIRLTIAATTANLGQDSGPNMLRVMVCNNDRATIAHGHSYDCSSTHGERGGVNGDVWAGSVRKATTINTRSDFRI